MKFIRIIAFITCLIVWNIVSAQNIVVDIQNASQVVEGSDTFYEADVVVTTDTDFIIGLTTLWIDYNTEAFGESIFALGSYEALYPEAEGYIFGKTLFGGSLVLYQNQRLNDNNASKCSFFAEQAQSGSFISSQIGNNILAGTTNKLFKIRIKYLDSSKDAMICLDGTIAPNNVFPACSTASSCSVPDLTSISYACTGAKLGTLSTDSNANLLNTIQLSPNPVKNEVILSGDVDSLKRIEIFSINGQLIRQIDKDFDKKIDVSLLKSAVYFVKLHSDNGSQTIKLIKA